VLQIKKVKDNIKKPYWIGCPYDDGKDAVYIFRKTIKGKAGSFTAKISADTRYKLYINGQLVSVGPLKGTEYTTYYENVNLTEYLDEGKNKIEAHVLHLSDDDIYHEPISLNSVIRRQRAVFMFCGTMDDKKIVSDGTWEVCRDRCTVIERHQYSAYAALNEKKVNKVNEYTSAVEVEVCRIDNGCFNHYGELDTYVLSERSIPPLFIGEKQVLLSDESIEAGEKKTYVLDAKRHTTAYVHAHILGRGKVKLTYAECYEKPTDGGYVKGMRDDESGILRGDYDEIISDNEIEFDSYWFKTFRYITVEVEAEEALQIKEISYRETHYPLDITGKFTCSDDEYNKMHDVSVRTLLNCMHETFEDCPYYEQLQYVMDTNLQMLFAYQLSDDYALQKKAIMDFTDSRIPCGLLQSRFPSMKKQVIPGFSLYYIYMLDDYLLYTGDCKTVKECISVVDGILNWFDTKLDEFGLVGPTGYWPYVDWVPDWADGVPNGSHDKSLTVYSMMYSKALESAMHLAEATGREGLKEEYNQRHRKINKSIKKYCYDDSEKMFKDGPDMDTYSEHCQIWSILCDAADESEFEALAEKIFSEDIKKCTFSMRFFTLRALEKAGMYQYADKLYDGWRKMLNFNCTTWAETPENPRSECHAWSAVMLYEFAHNILGVKVNSDGITVLPYAGNLSYAEGVVPTRFGNVGVSWKKTEDGIDIQVYADEETMTKIKVVK